MLWAPINAHSMRAAIYGAYTLPREPENRYETVTEFEADDGQRYSKMMSYDDLTDHNTREYGTSIRFRR